MAIEHLSADTSADDIHEIIQRDGCVIIDQLIDRDTADHVAHEMARHLDATAKGTDEFSGFETRRAGKIIARSKTGRDLISNPTVLGVAAKALAHATNFQLHVTELTAVGPGSAPQVIHRDQWAFDLFPFPKGFDSTFASMWAISDFTEANGATRVVPRSHLMDDQLRFDPTDAEAAEMSAGSVLLYTGSAYHGAGGNQSDSVRFGLISQYTLGWLRQEENQYLSTPQEVLDTLDEPMLRLMGYQRGSYSLGFIDGGRDPIVAVRPELEREPHAEISLDSFAKRAS